MTLCSLCGGHNWGASVSLCAVCVRTCVSGGRTVLIELVSDDSGESHKKKEGMPKGSTGISFTLMSFSLPLPLFPPTFFWISALFFHSLFFFPRWVTEILQLHQKTPPPSQHTRANLYRSSRTNHLQLGPLKDWCSIVWTAQSVFNIKKGSQPKKY